MNDDIKWLFGILIIAAAAWIVGGGVSRPSANDPFIRPITDAGNIQTYGGKPQQPSSAPAGGSYSYYTQGQYTGQGYQQSQQTQVQTQYIQSQIQGAERNVQILEQELERIQKTGETSPLRGQIYIAQVTLSGSASENEYVVLRTPPTNKERIKITGMKLTSSKSGQTATVGEGSYLPFSGYGNFTEPIFLEPGEVAYVITGRSPIGTSFRINKCSGYMQQFQKYIPSLPGNCPHPINEPLPPNPFTDDERCEEYISRIPVCQVVMNPTSTLPEYCQRHIQNEISYNKCIGFHKAEPDFYGGEWRVYLDLGGKLWKTRKENIRLVDQDGQTIHSYTY